tara:strand:+ start:642 stop:2096 length:1455 start_codon:yes stop_codon:yes gene_type:complete
LNILLDKIGSITSLYNDKHWSNQKISLEVKSRLNKLSTLGVTREDRVIILHGSTPAFFADLFAVWGLGACAVCLNPNLSSPEVRRIIDFIDPRLLLLNENQESFSNLPSELLFDLNKYRKKSKSKPDNPNASKLDDNALILFTSGTTSTPKGVVHTFRSLLSRISLNSSYISLEDLNVTLCPLPTHFGHGLIGNCLTPLLSGKELILVPGGEIETITNFGSLIDKYNVTFLSSVPTLWKLAVKLAKPPTGGTLKRVHIGSAPLSGELWSEVIEWSGVNQVLNMYGITETANWIAGASAKDYRLESGLIGKMWGGTAAVKNESDILCSVGEGEIMLQSPSVMSGYYNLPELTANSLQNGWFATGDTGSIDNNGLLRLMGRIKFEINKAGMKINPEDIDILLESNTHVNEACAFGLSDPIVGETVAVAISPRDSAVFDLDSLKTWCSDNLVHEKVPEKWFILEEIPKTDRGKINRNLVAEVCLKKK